jgi:hypothetical protein
MMGRQAEVDTFQAMATNFFEEKRAREAAVLAMKGKMVSLREVVVGSPEGERLAWIAARRYTDGDIFALGGVYCG